MHLTALSRHTSIEEQILYPWAREYIDQSDDEVLEALEEHHVVKWLLWELEDLARRRAVRRQGDGDDGERPSPREGGGERPLPDLRDVATRTELLELGDASVAKKRAPTRAAPTRCRHAAGQRHDGSDRVGARPRTRWSCLSRGWRRSASHKWMRTR